MQSTENQVLVVDDEPQICTLVRDALSLGGIRCLVAATPRQALELLRANEITVVLTDIAMPELSGLDLLTQIQQIRPSCKVILMTGQASTQCLADALNLGAYDFFRKPFDLRKLTETIAKAAGDRSSHKVLPLRAAKAMQMEDQLRNASLESILALAKAVEAKDPYTRRHSENVTHYSVSFANYLGLPDELVESIRVSALLHDIGKIGIPDQILTKPGALTDEEFEMIRKHPTLGAEILKNISRFTKEAQCVRYHHERWDGAGYPDGLEAEQIPLGARIIGVADSMDAMLHRRVYKEAFPVQRVLKELADCAGTQFDPAIAAAAIEWSNKNPGNLILPPKSVAC